MEHSNLVTIWWLIGAVIALLAILIPIIVHYSEKKVDKDLCLLRHTDLDKSVIEIKETAKNTQGIVSDISKSMVRVETILKTKP